MKPINVIGTITLILCFAAESFHISAQTSAANDNSQNFDQKLIKTVKSILLHYCKPLNSDDARAIINSFLSAGLQKGSDLDSIIQQQGFDPDLLYKLAEEQHPKSSY